MSVASSIGGDQEDLGVPPPPVAESLAAPPAEWYLHEQTTRLEVDLEREELRGMDLSSFQSVHGAGSRLLPELGFDQDHAVADGR